MLHPPMHRVALLLFAAVVLSGCSSDSMLPVAPNVLRDGSGSAQLRELPPEQQKPDMEILYVTDRGEVNTGTPGLKYGFGRSNHTSYGVATVSLGTTTTWDDLVTYSGQKSSEPKYKMEITNIAERGQYAPSLTRMGVQDGRYVLVDVEGEQKEIRDAQAVLAEALAKRDKKDVYIFIHGFENSFEDAVLRLAGIWHYLGRRGVAVAYSWPAGHGGLFGYLYDRESGEYTVYHLKRTLRIIAGCSSVERVHIISHSRGTDVALTALRELNGEYRGAGKDPQAELKLQTLVLAAPDIDSDVFGQRFGAENLIGIAKQVVIYGSRDDEAIAFARWIFGNGKRLGSFDPSKVKPEVVAMLVKLPNLEFIQARVSGLSSSHAYMFSNPAALSDLVLLLRDGKSPGAANGRPLTPEVGWWYFDNTYFSKTGEP